MLAGLVARGAGDEHDLRELGIGRGGFEWDAALLLGEFRACAEGQGQEGEEEGGGFHALKRS